MPVRQRVNVNCARASFHRSEDLWLYVDYVYRLFHASAPTPARVVVGRHYGVDRY